jgi:Na+/H+ antiporter NhaD/arsenite permease-like protein
MTISALLLSRKFFDHKPSPKLIYATLGLLFVNVSIGGTLTHFAAPPVLMIASKWKWDTAFMLEHFGWRAALAVGFSCALYFVLFRKEFAALNALAATKASHSKAPNPSAHRPIPFWIVLISFGFLVWTVINSHHPPLVIAGFLFYLAFSQVTHQDQVRLRPALLVGFFLAGLVVHGGLQEWWIEPVLRSLGRLQLFWGATVLTAFNDNAAITYLASQMPDLGDSLKYAVVTGAVTGGGLTVIANAPNPAGQSILAKYLPDGVSPLKLFLGALIPTAIVAACFLMI